MLAPVGAHGHGRSRRPIATDVSWSDCVVDAPFAHDQGGGLGLRFRSAVTGPEQHLVDMFLKTAKARLTLGRELMVFAQPAIETGFPDLVAVIWREDVARGWVTERERLRASDLRLLHLLATQGPIDLMVLQGVFQRGLQGMLCRLQDAAVVTIGKSSCRARQTSKIFAVERIIAVEAKISATQRVLEQAGGTAGSVRSLMRCCQNRPRVNVSEAWLPCWGLA